MVRGYLPVVNTLAKGLDIRLGHRYKSIMFITDIFYSGLIDTCKNILEACVCTYMHVMHAHFVQVYF